MNAIAFLLIAVSIAVVGCVVLWYKHRTPTTLDSGIRAFQREMEALAPPDDEHERSDGSS